MNLIDNIIEVKSLEKKFKDFEALKGITFSVSRGSIIAILGPNGAGKTTTIKILSTLLSQDKGDVSINGFDVKKDSNGVRSSIGLTGQFAAVDEYLTGKENLQMIGRLYRLRKEEVEKRSNDLIKQFDLVEASKRPVKTYSGGMKRRLDLAMSLIASPPIIFLDEPTTGLDPRSRLVMWEMIKKLVSNGTTILLTTQYMDEADYLADKILVIDNGKVIAQGTPDELKAHVGSDRLEISIKQKNDFSRAQEIVQDQDFQIDNSRRIISISTRDGTKKIKEMLQRFEDSEIEVSGVSLRRPTLDDVFLSLTGNATNGEGNNGRK